MTRYLPSLHHGPFSIISTPNGLGVAPGAVIAFFDLRGCADRNQGMVIPGLDLGRHVLSWAYACGARIHLNAWTIEGGEEGRKTGYDWLARDVDRYMYERPNTLVISAAGDLPYIVSPGLAKVNEKRSISSNGV